MEETISPFRLVVTGRPQEQKGQSLVELALALPIFLIVVLGIVDFGMGLKSWIAIENGAREAARYGAVNCTTGDADTNAIQDRAVDATDGLGLTTSNVTVTNCTADASGQSLVVEIAYDYKLITPLGGLLNIFGGGIDSTFSLKSHSDMRME